MDFRITCNLGLPLHVASFLKVGRGADSSKKSSQAKKLHFQYSNPKFQSGDSKKYMIRFRIANNCSSLFFLLYILFKIQPSQLSG